MSNQYNTLNPNVYQMVDVPRWSQCTVQRPRVPDGWESVQRACRGRGLWEALEPQYDTAVSQTLRCGLYREYFASTAHHTVSVHSPNPATLTICAGAGVNWHLRGGKENGMSAERESSLRGTVIIIMPIRTRGKKKKRKDSIQWRIRQRRDPVETKKRYER